MTQQCWIADPNKRPTFTKVCNMLHYILEDEGDYVRPQKRK